MQGVVRKMLLPVVPFRDGIWRAETQIEFKPRGLAIWGTPPGASLALALVGPRLQLVASLGNVPARFFNQGDSFEQIAKKLDEGKEPPAWGDWEPVHPGFIIELRLVDTLNNPLPADGIEIAMWGEGMAL